MGISDVRRRLDELIRENDEDYVSVSKLLGRNSSYIQQFIKRGVPRKLREDDRRKLAAHFGVSEYELGGPAGFRAAPDKTATGVRDDFLLIPVYDIRVSAGDGQFPGVEEAISLLAFQADWIRSVTSAPIDKLAVLKVDGDSMYPTLAQGDHILVDTTDRDHVRDGIYVIRTDDVLQVKRISPNPAGRKLNVKSDNPAYESWPDCAPSEIEIVGRVAWVGRRL